MDLESILRKAWAETDQEILRFYTKMGENIPDENLYKTATKWLLGTRIPQFSLAGCGVVYFMTHYSPEIINNVSSSHSLTEILGRSIFTGMKGILFGIDLWHNILGLTGVFPTAETDVQTRGSYFKEKFQKISRALRLPVVALGLYETGKSCFDVYQTVEGDKFFGYIISDGASAIGLFGLATSMYLKDRNPKLLKKDPFWKRAYGAIAEKIGDYSPQPVPVPIRMQQYAVAESTSV